MSKKDDTLFHGIYLYETKKEKPIARLKVIKNKVPSLLILEEPKKGFHRHYYFDNKTGKVKGHIKDEKTKKKKEINESFQEFRNKKIDSILK